MSVLRIYDPAECDSSGVPLDWERCQCFDGSLSPEDFWPACPRCAGHGSLKAAALAEIRAGPKAGMWRRAPVTGERYFAYTEPIHPAARLRCEDCGHPMSEGTWEDPPLAVDLGYVETRARAERAILAGRSIAPQVHSQHYSPCDEGCWHPASPGRFRNVAGEWVYDGMMQGLAAPSCREASWRPVDVRRLGWPCDLRPERLAILCLRCWAARSSPTEEKT